MGRSGQDGLWGLEIGENELKNGSEVEEGCIAHGIHATAHPSPRTFMLMRGLGEGLAPLRQQGKQYSYLHQAATGSMHNHPPAPGPAHQLRLAVSDRWHRRRRRRRRVRVRVPPRRWRRGPHRCLRYDIGP